MDLDAFKESIIENVYHITAETKVPLHKHDGADEIFYCIRGSGYQVLEEGEKELNVGGIFFVPARTMHSLRSDTDLYVCSFLIPKVE